MRRYANLAHLKCLSLLLPGGGWVLTKVCSESLLRRFPQLTSLELGLPLSSTHDPSPLQALAQRGCKLEIALEAESEPDDGSADQGAELLRLLQLLQLFQAVERLTICVASLSDAQQQQLAQLRGIEYLDLELDKPYCERSYDFPLVGELDVSEREFINQDNE